MAEARPASDRLYTIASVPEGHVACGVVPSGEQVLMGLGGKALLAVFFTPSGEWLRCEEREVAVSLPDDLPSGERRFQTLLRWQDALGEWQEALGVRHQDIAVRRFFVREYDVGISDLPDGYIRAFRRRPSLGPEEQLALDRRHVSRAQIRPATGGAAAWTSPCPTSTGCSKNSPSGSSGTS